MGSQRKSPQEKKVLGSKKDHYTFAEYPHGFRTAWPLKKALANREYRRKADELLSQAKTGMSSEEVDPVTGELTAAQIRNSVSRKRLRKSGTVSAGEKIRITLEKRTAAAGRRANKRRNYDLIVTSAVETLNSLEGEILVDAVKRIAVLLQGGDSVEWAQLYQSADRLDRAVFFVERIVRGDGNYRDALRRDRVLCESFQLWKKKASGILAKLYRPQQRKIEQKIANEKKVKTLRRELGKG